MPGNITILTPDTSQQALNTWQRLKSPSIAQTAITATLLNTDMREASFAQTTVEAMDVSLFDVIQVGVLANGSNNHTPILQFYGWSDSGPGQHIGQVTTALGNFTSAASTGWHAADRTHASIKAAFDSAIAWRGSDTHTVIDYQSELVIDGAATQIPYEQYRALNAPNLVAAGSIDTEPEADFPSYITVNLSRNRYKFLICLVSSLGSATTVGAIFKPISFRANGPWTGI